MLIILREIFSYILLVISFLLHQHWLQWFPHGNCSSSSSSRVPLNRQDPLPQELMPLHQSPSRRTTKTPRMTLIKARTTVDQLAISLQLSLILSLVEQSFSILCLSWGVISLEGWQGGKMSSDITLQTFNYLNVISREFSQYKHFRFIKVTIRNSAVQFRYLSICMTLNRISLCLELNSTCWLALKYALLAVVAILAGMRLFLKF